MSLMSEWVPLLEYAVQNEISVSTLRRYIKGKKVRFKIEGGRYLIFNPEGRRASHDSPPPADLSQALKLAQEEIAELKTLIAFYEEQIAPPSPRF